VVDGVEVALLEPPVRLLVEVDANVALTEISALSHPWLTVAVHCATSSRSNSGSWPTAPTPRPRDRTASTIAFQSETPAHTLADVDFPSGKNLDACGDAVHAARRLLKEQGAASMREIVAAVHPDHPLGYDVDAALAKVEAGERYRGAWWRRIVKPGLETFDDVEKPARGASEWRYTGDP